MNIPLPKQAGFATIEYAIAGALILAAIFVAFTHLGDAVAGSITPITEFLGSGGSGSDSLAESGSNVWFWIIPIPLVIFVISELIQRMIRK